MDTTRPRDPAAPNPVRQAPAAPAGRRDAPWWRRSVADNFIGVGGRADGLSESEAHARLVQHGRNVFRDAPPRHLALEFLRRFRNPLVMLLLFAGAISAGTGQVVSAVCIALMVVLSISLDFIQEHRAEQTAERLKQSVALRAQVKRAGVRREIAADQIVPGDVVLLRAGQLIPADGRLLEARHLFVQQAALTGEAYPVEKDTDALPASDELQAAQNALFMGSSVVSGEASMLVCATGMHTQIGHVAQALGTERRPTAFEVGVAEFGRLILRVTSALVVFVLAVNLFAGQPALQSFMFALALAVGLTPELLPMVVTVTLSRGAHRLSGRHVIVKRLSAIQDLGAMDVLCTDKTGTLTEGAVRLAHYPDLRGQDSDAVLRYGWLNCHFESGVRTPLEEAVLAHGKVDPSGWNKIDEVPFDFERRRLSVLLARDGEPHRYLILKGAPRDVIGHCVSVQDGGATVALDGERLQQARAQITTLETSGHRTLAVAFKKMPPERDHARLDDETELTLLGFLAFLDPPKPGAALAMHRLERHGVRVKVVTGDSELVTQYICRSLAIPVGATLVGDDIEKLDDAALRKAVEATDLFCRVNPTQKNRVIAALRDNGHVVAYLGDGINDAPALHHADVGISVDSAVDVAREAADLILLRRNLGVLVNGVLEGRRTFANVRKYIMMGTSSNFGNMFSMAGASLFLPFLPMQPAQILLNNVLYDLSESVLPLDAVDQQEIERPHRWDMMFLRNFMLTMGPVSSLFDFLTFYLLIHVFHAGEALFQTGWFVESLATQVLVIFVIRTRLRWSASRPHPALVAAAVGAIFLAVAIPLSPVGAYFGFARLPAWFYAALAALVAAYLVLAEGVKRQFYRRLMKRGPVSPKMQTERQAQEPP